MKVYFSETRANGQPITPGTLAHVVDAEDGTHPIFTYAKDHDELAQKLGIKDGHAQSALRRLEAELSTARAKTPTGALPAAAQPRKRMTPDETVLAVSEIQSSPGKAGDAIVRLVQDATGVDLRQQAYKAFCAMAEDEWEPDTPEFYPHPGNRRLLMAKVRDMAGGDITRGTRAMLQQAFESLRDAQLLFEEPEHVQQQQPPQSSTTFPAETQVQRTERPRGSRFGMSTRSTSFAAPQARPSKTLKYTEAQFRSLSSERSRQLIQANDADYLAANEVYGQDAVTA